MVRDSLGLGEPFAFLLREPVQEESVCAAPSYEHEQEGGIEEAASIIGLGLVFAVCVCAVAVCAR